MKRLCIMTTICSFIVFYFRGGSEMITSAGNSRIKQVVQLNKKAKVRRELGLFVAEGIKMFQESPKDWIEEVYLSESLYEEKDWEGELAGILYEVVSNAVFGKMCDTMTPQGILTVLRQPVYDWEDLMGNGAPLLMVLEDLQDPGNLGTILRTAEGAGANGIILSRGCVDLFNPKTIRSTMGSIFRMPFIYVDNLKDLKEKLDSKNIGTYAAHLNGEGFYDAQDYTGGTAFLIGNEGKGLSEELTAHAARLIRIPMAGEVESLNAAMAGGILLYEAARQRRNS